MQSRNLFIINVKCLWMWIAEVDVSMLMLVYNCCCLLLHFESSMKTQCIEKWMKCIYVCIYGWLTAGCKFYGDKMDVGLALLCTAASMRTFSALKIFFRFLFRLLFCCLFPVSVKKWFDKLKAANTKRRKREQNRSKEERMESGCHTGNRKTDLLFVHFRMKIHRIRRACAHDAFVWCGAHKCGRKHTIIATTITITTTHFRSHRNKI